MNMSFIDFLFRIKEPIRPELIVAFNSKIPDSITVRIYPSKDGGYIAAIENIDNCVTQSDSGKEMIEMVNDAMHTSLGIPEEYKNLVTHFQPSQEIIEEFGMTIPDKYLNRNFIMEKIVA